MTTFANPQLTHVGIFVRDLDTMVDFYCKHLGLVVTDQGKYRQHQRIAFLSRNSREHHQLVLASGRPEDAHYTTVNQISFIVADLDQLKAMHSYLSESGISVDRAVSHGNAWSFYFMDPEGNKVEIYTPAVWHIQQPFGREVDLSKSVSLLIEETRTMLEGEEGATTRELWAAGLNRQLAELPQPFKAG